MCLLDKMISHHIYKRAIAENIPPHFLTQLVPLCFLKRLLLFHKNLDLQIGAHLVYTQKGCIVIPITKVTFTERGNITIPEIFM